MKTCLASFLFLLFQSLAFAQDSPCREREMKARVLSKTGLKLRSDPSQKADVKLSAAYWSLVDLCESDFVHDTIDGTIGSWWKVRYKGTEGYMFGGYLVQVDSTHSQYKDVRIMGERSYCSQVNYDPALNWYGVYRMDGFDTIMRVEIEISLLGEAEAMSETGGVGGISVRTNHSDSLWSLFLIGSKTPLVESSVRNGRFEGKWMFPGQSQDVFVLGREKYSKTYHPVPLDERPPRMSLIALGSVTDVEYCPQIEGYRLVLKSDKSNAFRQNITDHLRFKGECGMPNLFWFGDLDGDKKPDLVFEAGATSMVEYTLFLSSLANENEYVHMVDSWTSCNCH
jgi:hypothetical protein